LGSIGDDSASGRSPPKRFERFDSDRQVTNLQILTSNALTNFASQSPRGGRNSPSATLPNTQEDSISSIFRSWLRPVERGDFSPICGQAANLDAKELTVIKKIIAATLGLAIVTGSFGAETIIYTYDAKGRLIKVVRTGTVNNNVTTDYTHDKANNRKTVVTTNSPNPPSP
jgi:hypothetical protein